MTVLLFLVTQKDNMNHCGEGQAPSLQLGFYR